MTLLGDGDVLVHFWLFDMHLSLVYSSDQTEPSIPTINEYLPITFFSYVWNMWCDQQDQTFILV